MRASEYEERLTAGELKPEAPDEPMVEWTNPRTGEVKRIPWAIDPGFGYNVGEASLRWRELLDVAADKAAGWAAPIAGATLAELAGSPAFARWYDDPQGAWPLARLPDADARALGANDGVRVARMSDETAIKQRHTHPELTPQEYAEAQRAIDEATHKIADGNSMMYVRVLPAAGGYVLVVKVTRTGAGIWVTSYRRLSRDEAQRDSEIRRLLRKAGEG